jgi:hypothetical protein
MTLTVTNERVAQIEQYIATNSIANAKQKYDTLQWKFRGGDLKDVDNTISGNKYSCDTVFNIDIDLLHYNFTNRRILIYRKEREIEKQQNPQNYESPIVNENNKEDIEWMKRLLLGKENMYGVRSNTEGFTSELIQNHQLEPAIITIDGTLRNGNRRKAIFHDILEKIKNKRKDKNMDYSILDPEPFKRLKAIILPRDITEEELFDLENFLQTKRDWKQAYDPFSVLNIIKEAVDKYELSFEEIKKRYLHDMDVSKIRSDYFKIRKMDEYLESIESPGQYGKIQNQMELFEDNVNYSFEEVGLANIPREQKSFKDKIVRERKQLFFDIVAANACNNEVLRPSEKAVRKLVQEVFKEYKSHPERILSEIYSGIDREKLRTCESVQVDKFGYRIDSLIAKYQGQNVEKAPLAKLKRIISDVNNLRQGERQKLARKKETAAQIGLLKEAVANLEKDIATFQQQLE